MDLGFNKFSSRWKPFVEIIQIQRGQQNKNSKNSNVILVQDRISISLVEHHAFSCAADGGEGWRHRMSLSSYWYLKLLLQKLKRDHLILRLGEKNGFCRKEVISVEVTDFLAAGGAAAIGWTLHFLQAVQSKVIQPTMGVLCQHAHTLRNNAR